MAFLLNRLWYKVDRARRTISVNILI